MVARFPMWQLQVSFQTLQWNVILMIPQRKITKQSWKCLPFLLFRLSFFVLIKNKIEQIQYDIVKLLSSLSDEQKKEFSDLWFMIWTSANDANDAGTCNTPSTVL